MKKYKIGQLAQQFGITPQTIRFYEKEGIFCSTLPEDSTTRQYYLYHFKWLSGVRRYLMMGFSTKEIKAIYECDNPEAIVSHMQKKRSELRRQIEYLQGNEAMLTRSIRTLEDISNRIGIPELVQSPEMYIILNQDRKYFISSKAIEERIHEWMAYLPYVDEASVVHPDQPDHRYGGFCVTAEIAEKLGLRVDAPARFYPSTRCVHLFARKTDRASNFSIFNGLTDFLSENHLKITGPAFGKCLVKTNESLCMKNGRSGFLYFEYWIPVADDA